MLKKTNGSKVFDTLMFDEPLVVAVVGAAVVIDAGELVVVVVVDRTVEILDDCDSTVDIKKP